MASSGAIGERRAREALWAGLAGVPVTKRGRVLYNAEAVAQLTQRPFVDPGDVDPAIRPVLVVRMPARHEASLDDDRGWIGVDVTASNEEQDERFRQWWVPPAGGFVGLKARLNYAGRFPLVVTVAGLVAATRDVVGVSDLRGGRVAFSIVTPDTWAYAFDQHWLPTGRGAAPLVWWP